MPSIILSDNGVSSGSAGLKSTAASDGALALQTTTSGGTATTAVTIDTSQNVGIGNASPARQLSIYGSFPCLQLTNATAGATANDGLLIFQNGLNAAISNQEAGYVAFETANTERMRINAGAPILCLSGGNTSATGTGIAFPATQSASSDANTLDDYEEGTWTVTDQSGAGLSLSNTTCTYIKIGRLVFFAIDCVYPSTASGVQAKLSLPFPPSSTNTPGSAAVGYTGAASICTVYISPGSGLATIYAVGGAGFTNASLSGREIAISGCYYCNG